MTENQTNSREQAAISIHLLDPSAGRVLKTWKFKDRAEITIGRGEERDVQLDDSYVSRQHATLTCADQGWVLSSQGRNGVLVNNRSVESAPLKTKTSFRLGSGGPVLQFCPDARDDGEMRTITFDETSLPLLELNQAQVDLEVTKITEGEFFQSLQEKAAQFRQRRVDTSHSR